MILRIGPHSGVPVHRQLMRQVRFQVAAGRVTAGNEALAGVDLQIGRSDLLDLI